LSLINELRNRHVFRVATWYAAAAWLIIQIADTAIPGFNLPAWTIRAVIVTALIGFPIALLLAWAFDLSSAGIKRTARATTTPAAPGDARSFVSLALAVAAGVLLGVGAITGWHAFEAPAARPGIAVLAFDVLGQEANRALAGGLQEAVLNELAHLSGLRVIARTSVLRFAESKADIREVGRILDVPYVLEGSVQREGGQLRVHAQLIDANSNAHIWSETYNRAADDIFGVQTALAHDISERLRVTLLPPEVTRAATPPTTVPAAYELFLQGLAELNNYNASGFSSALPSLQAALTAMNAALALDADFALAHAERARILMIFWFDFRDTQPDASGAREQALLAVTEAIRVAPELGEAHRALGLYYYWGLLDYPRAERELLLAQSLLPNDSVSRVLLGLVRRRQNRFAEAIELFRQAYRLNPGDVLARETYALDLFASGRYAEADQAMKDMLARFPEARDPGFGRALIRFCRSGETQALRAAADAGLSGPEMEDYARWLAARYEGRFDEALMIVRNAAADDFGFEYRPLALAESFFLVGDFAAAAAVAQPLINRIEADVLAQANDLNVYAGLADAYLFAGRVDDARRAARAYLDSTPLEHAALEYWEARRQMAKVYATLGDTGQALELLTLYQHGPWHECGNQLRFEPMYASLRDDPGFAALAAESDWK